MNDRDREHARLIWFNTGWHRAARQYNALGPAWRVEYCDRRSGAVRRRLIAYGGGVNPHNNPHKAAGSGVID